MSIAPILLGRYRWPTDVEVDADLKDLVDRMLARDPTDRLGNLIFGPDDPQDPRLAKNDELRAHPFFKGVQWKHIRDRKLAVSTCIFGIHGQPIDLMTGTMDARRSSCSQRSLAQAPPSNTAQCSGPAHQEASHALSMG